MEFLCLACGVIGMIVGGILTLLWIRRKKAGVLAVYISDTDDPAYMTAELSESVAHVCKQKRVVFEVAVRRLRTRQ